MFGYVTVNKPELKMKEYDRYRAYYCGLCNVLQQRHGIAGQMTLTYDMTFLVILLSSLYEPEIACKKKRCMVHPVKKHTFFTNEITAYAADMNVALAYHHFRDDWQDEKKINGLAGIAILRKKYGRIEKQYPRQCEVIESSLKQLQEYEEKGEKSLDLVSGCFGTLMAELLVYKKDAWEETLRRLGFFLGKYIYLIDAYMDLEDDLKNESYNPLIDYKDRTDYEEFCHEILKMMISESAACFEMLPCVEDAEILRNILYGGVWTRYYAKKGKKEITVQ